MVSAFEARARDLYGERSQPAGAAAPSRPAASSA